MLGHIVRQPRDFVVMSSLINLLFVFRHDGDRSHKVNLKVYAVAFLFYFLCLSLKTAFIIRGHCKKVLISCCSTTEALLVNNLTGQCKERALQEKDIL